MNKNEMLPVNSYTALKDFNLAEAMLSLIHISEPTRH